MTTTLLSSEPVAAIGSPEPLGATFQNDGVNFAVHSGAERVSLLLFTNVGDIEPSHIVPMNETGDVFHVSIQGAKPGQLYLYRAEGKYDPKAGDRYHEGVQLIDPAAEMVTSCSDWVAPLAYDASNVKDDDRDLKKGHVVLTQPTPKCVVVGPSRFDWQGDTPPNTPLVETVIYEVSVQGFTGSETCPTKFRGTYKGMVDMIPHLVALGVTAVELLPIMVWYRPTGFYHPDTGEELLNDWAYNSVVFGAPDADLATEDGAQDDELMLLVREMHKAGLEVYLDIVPNHVGEGKQYGPTISLRGLDNKTYNILVPDQLHRYMDYSGCGNTVNCNHPVVRKLILFVLRRWVEKYHVDGFRFDLAAILGIDCDLSVKANSPILEEIANDPVLANVKLIAEPWSCGVYLMGQFPGRWSEWCGRYRDTVRAFVRGEAGQVSALATAVTGSQDMMGDGKNGRLPINFATAHDGFSLRDLVSYDGKHNRENGEDGKDGTNDNRSWNCGYEGEVTDAPISDDEKKAITALRLKQIKNFLVLLMVSRGVPMIVAGDEMGRTNKGNNNPYVQRLLNQLLWTLLKEFAGLFRFASMMIGFRKKHSLGGKGHNPVFRPITWHGTKPNQPNWADWARTLVFELGQFTEAGQDPDSPVYVAANAYWEEVTVELPQGDWYRIVDTSLDTNEDIVEEEAAVKVEGKYKLAPRSTIVLIRR